MSIRLPEVAAPEAEHGRDPWPLFCSDNTRAPQCFVVTSTAVAGPSQKRWQEVSGYSCHAKSVLTFDCGRCLGDCLPTLTGISQRDDHTPLRIQQRRREARSPQRLVLAFIAFYHERRSDALAATRRDRSRGPTSTIARSALLQGQNLSPQSIASRCWSQELKLAPVVVSYCMPCPDAQIENRCGACSEGNCTRSS